MEDDILQKEPNDNFKLFHLHQEKPEPSIMVLVKVNRVSHSMELDTGASVSIMSEEAWRRRFPESPIRGVPNQVEDLQRRSSRNYRTSTGGSNILRSDHQVAAPNYKKKRTKPI